MNHYEIKQEARRERLEARAERLQREANSAFKRADLSEAATGIPFGQPILVGHHSEKRHRAVIARANRALDKGIALNKAAKEVAGRAASVGSGGISSDDPEAIGKLKAELVKAEERHAREKAINAAIRKHAKAGPQAQVAAIVALGFSAELAARLLEPPYPGGPVGIPAYSLSNRTANMARIKDRIAHLERVAKQREGAGGEKIEREIGGVRIVENLEENRLQLIFPGKPSGEVRAKLKGHGFRWAPSEGAWQRHLSNGAKWAAEQIVAGL